MSCASASVRSGQDALPVAGPSAPSTMMPYLHSINEDGAMRILAEMLDALDTHGLALFSESGHGAAWPLSSPTTWSSALAVLATSAPLNAMVADTLLERVSAALSVEIGVYQSAVLCCSGPLSTEVALPALERLGEVYRQVHSHLLRWCSALHTPGVAALLAVRLRCALLQTDLVTGEEPPGRQALFTFLRWHGRFVLATQRKAAGDGDEEEARGSECDGTLGEAGDASESALAPASASPAPDSLMACLHRLALNRSAEVKQLWRSVLEDGIRDRLSDLSDDFSTRILHKHLSWLEHSVVPFVRMVLPDSDGESDPLCRSSGNLSDGTSTNRRCGDVGMTSEGCHTVPRRAQEGDACPSSQTNEAVRAEREAWCADLRLLLLHTYARRRLDGFWEILSDYPDSVPALEDMRYCLQSTPESGLKTELVQTVRHMLSSRLHRAGTRTDDILAILINTIHAFCILFPRNEQSSVVFSVTSDTLEHLRRRKDCVPAVVQAVMQPGGAMNVAPPPLTQAASEGLAGSLDFDGDAGSKEGELHRAASRGRPDVVRVLLTSIPRRALVDEYQQMLAEQLLQKPMHQFDTTPEEEVLERLRHVFGETALDRCAVMMRDMQMSRRISQQLREQLGPRRTDCLPQLGPTAASATAVSPAASVSVLSMTAWPPLVRCSSANGGDSGPAAAPLKFCPHPALQEEMDTLAEAYKRLKDNQRMTWLPSLGRVELELKQKDPSKGNSLVAVPQILSLFDASFVLHVKEMTSRGGSSTPVHLKEVAAVLEVQLEELRAHAQRLSPAVLMFQPATDLVTMQLSVAASADFVFMEDRETDEESGKPAGLPPERVKLMERMVTSLLKTRGAQSSTAIHSSLKLLGKFEGSNADVVELLRSFVGRGLIVLNDARQYALPPK
ncbi:Cullin family [Leishmania donovani]|uniref:Cullin family protein n=1 Tax=Leishmania donovani TaxID=5661 RepID=A0A504XS69_LEIDO|nr:Cullin family protein [Leishmania donovani]CAJ1993190.1 Cullin family [Leishmania donovani]VDZ49017.1 Cullin_family_putative/Pfam:PF00888 [Leishmania donovani]